MKSIYYLLVVLLFSSCVSSRLNEKEQRISANAQNIKNIGMECHFIEQADPNKDLFDSTFQDVIKDFNRQQHIFTVNNKQLNDSFSVDVNFTRTRFASKGAVTASYIVSAAGLIALPILTYGGSNGKLIVFAWFFATDKADVNFTKSRYLKEYSSRLGARNLKSGALFTSVENRKKNLTNLFYNSLISYLNNIETDIKRRIAKSKK